MIKDKKEYDKIEVWLKMYERSHYGQGAIACSERKSRLSCPYEAGTEAFENWHNGYNTKVDSYCARGGY